MRCGRLASLDVTTESRVASRLLYMRGIDRRQLLHDDGPFPEAALTDYDLQICCKKDQAHDAAVMASAALSLLGSVLAGSRKAHWVLCSCVKFAC
jgi:hypothetical protein